MMLDSSGVAPSAYLPFINPPSWAYQHKYIQGNILQAVCGICRDLSCKKIFDVPFATKKMVAILHYSTTHPE